ncbi:PIG-L family deacetylase [Microaerobacter geothermalis]|uniref:PIG-L deacetylase family protein n=1 Tax=Microaerobacter geothermalis TaxID=674972 RepID=UPI001F25774E|nr:PIG-L family deacetylase [Microaerobacter geothermalis]MCF6093324.1 PIG-L family deacetylase [Microaerobacter geothermalis]
MNSFNYESQRVLILAPHADDETIGCGGVIQKYIKYNSQVRILIASFVMGQYIKYQKENEEYKVYSGKERIKEMQEAFRILGITDFHFLFVDDSEMIQYHSQLDILPKIRLVTKIEEHIRDFKPTIMYIPSLTKHQDHVILHEVGMTVARPYFWNGSVIVYETDGELMFQPNLYVPLTNEEMDRKKKALSAYKTQLGKERHPVHPHSQTVKAQFRGQNIYEYCAEAFQIVRLHG